MPTSDGCLTEVERSWLAAITDGEGCIRINRTRRKDTRAGWRYYPVIELTNTNKALVDKFVALTKSWVTRIREYSNDHFCKNAKRRFQVEIRNRSCEDFLHAVRPYLLAKGEQADLMFEFIALQDREGKKNKRLVPTYNEFYVRSRVLNTRGVKDIDVNKLREDVLPTHNISNVCCNSAE
jgi:hypothetical protein